MSGETPPDADAPATPAERRLVELLGPLRDDPPRDTPGTARAVVARARWQGPLRAALQSATRLVSAVGDAIEVALGLTRDRDPDRVREDPEAQA